MALIETVREALMLDSDEFDHELNALISASKRELVTAGVVEESTDPLYETAVVFYCKAHFGMDNPDSDRYEKRFEKLKHILSMDDATRDQWGDAP